MSGGPYGRGKAPERACMPPVHWPESDKLLWQAACAPADLLDEDVGARSGHATISNLKVEKGYGRWLTYLSISAPECLADPPAARITCQRVKAYVERLRSLKNGTATLLARLQELDSAANVMGPNQSWRFINRIASRIRASHRPVRDKRNLKLTDELLDLGIALMKKAKSEKGCSAAISFRDGLLIAFLALVPLRRRNLAGILLGQNLVEINGQWIVVLDAEETKTHAPHELDLPDILRAPLHTYLREHRPRLTSGKGRWSKPVGHALWVSKDGSPMTQMAIYDRIRVRTKEAFGTPINPHLFRDAAATTLAIADPQHVRVAAPLLGHRTFATTERHYVQAMGLEAQRAYVRAVFGRRAPSR